MTSRLWRESHLGLNGAEFTESFKSTVRSCPLSRKTSPYQRYFPDNFLCDVSMQELSARRHWAWPLWNTEDAVHAGAHARQSVAARECPAATSLTRWGTGACRNYGTAPPRMTMMMRHSLETIQVCQTSGPTDMSG